MKPLQEHLEASLRDLASRDQLRSLEVPVGIDFVTNDYLGLAHRDEIRESLLERVRNLASNSPASRLLGGELTEHRQLEERFARYKGTEASLLFSTGYQANLGLLGALISRDDRVLSDELNHASIIDGLKLCRAKKIIFRHLDLENLESTLTTPHAGGRTWIVTESLFSMDGDIAPLGEYARLADTYDASLIVDDAHATGLYGKERGSGLVEHFGIEGRVDAVISTFGKALGFFGAFVCGSRLLVDWLINVSRPFIFTTAPPPLLLIGMHAALDLVQAEPGLRSQVADLAARFRDHMHSASIDCLRSEGPIVPVVLGENHLALKVASRVRQDGFDVRAVRPPSVAPGTARLRVSIHADHDTAEIDGLADSIRQAWSALR